MQHKCGHTANLTIAVQTYQDATQNK